jgi:HSP20 family molecular chaperone IbpA
VTSSRREESLLREASELEPTAHVVDGPAEYRVEVDAPGLDAGDFEVGLTGRLLSVTGLDLRRPGTDATFEFVFRLPDLVAGEDVRAAFEHGKLVVRAPVRDGQARGIEIQSL